jgi:toxin ParE1/3/4
MGYRLRPQARRDLSEIIAYLAQRNHVAARKWRDEVFRVFELLGDNPQIGSAHDEVAPDLRMFPLGNYIVLYRVETAGVLVLRVIHASRDWRQKST